MKKSVVHSVSKITLILASVFSMNFVFAAAETLKTEQISNLNNAPEFGTSSLDIAIGKGSSNSTDIEHKSVAIGNEATTAKSNGLNHDTPGDVAIGYKARVNNYASQGGGIAIGDGAFSENMAGYAESIFSFGLTNWKGSGFLGMQSPFIPKDPAKAFGSIAIGRNSYARSGSVSIGDHTYNGPIADITDTKTANAKNINPFVTTIGSSSNNGGAFSTITGAFSTISSSYDGGVRSSAGHALKGFSSVINGSFNSIQNVKSNDATSGVASSIVGTVNKVENSNAALIFGSGNEITNSIESLSDFNPITNLLLANPGKNSPDEFMNFLMNKIQNNKKTSGGATLAIGGGNKANKTLRSQLTGVQNSLDNDEGDGKFSINNVLNGYQNEGHNVNFTTVIGSHNKISNSNNVLILGDNRKVSLAEKTEQNPNPSNPQHIIILGSQDDKTMFTFDKSDIVAIGHNTHVTNEGGIALGSGSVSNVDKEVFGLEFKKGTDGFSWSPSETKNSTWRATHAAVSVGAPGNGITRQIIGVAAGTNDTDAVNVAQLKAAIEAVSKNAGGNGDGKHTTVVAKQDTTSTNGGSTTAGSTTNTTTAPNTSTSGSNGSSTASTGSSTVVTSTSNNYVTVTPSPNVKEATEYAIDVTDSTKKAVDNANAVIVNKDSVVIDGQSKKITNIADGTEVHEAVNLGQLNKATTTINNRINNLSHHVDRVDRHARAGIASAMAAGALPQAYQPGKSMIAGGVATYRSASAVAFGLSSVSDDGSRIYKLNASANTEGDAGVAAGVGFQW